MPDIFRQLPPRLTPLPHFSSAAAAYASLSSLCRHAIIDTPLARFRLSSAMMPPAAAIFAAAADDFARCLMLMPPLLMP
jgi:hypothetical protein